MCSEAMRPIAFSFTDMTVNAFNELKEATQNFSSDNSIDQLLLNQTFIGLIALKDPLRTGVLDTIRTAKKGGITIRLVSGDNLETVKSQAVDCGILSKEHVEQTLGYDKESQYFIDAA